MPLIELNNIELLLLVFIISPLVELAAVLIGRKVPLSELTTDKWLYKERGFEEHGEFYKRVFKVHIWKKYLPDGAKCFKGDFTKNQMKSTDAAYLQMFIAEACRAELVHWLMFVPFLFYFLIAPPLLAVVLILVTGFINIPCVIAQRYNRPRLQAVIDRKISMMKLNEEHAAEMKEIIEEIPVESGLKG